MGDDRLQFLLQSWPMWLSGLNEKPRLVRPLHGGKTNRSYLLQSGDKKLVLRINASNSQQLGINRQHEKVILQQVAREGLAPHVYCCDPEQGFLVTEYIEGKPLDIRQPENLSRLHQLIQQIHGLTVDVPAFDYIAHAENYWQQLIELGHETTLDKSRKRLQQPLQILQAASGQGLCHHDLVPENIIDCDSRLVLLDWEYAGLGAPEFDRAVIRAEWSGFCVTPAGSEIQQAADIVYQEFCRLWRIINS